MALGVWPYEVVWVNLVLGLAFITIADSFSAVLFLIVSLPFAVAVPNPYFDSLSLWRILFGWLFLLWLLRALRSILATSDQVHFFAAAKRWMAKHFFVWDKYVILFVAVMILSTIFARFKVQSLKQALFLINAYLIYIVLVTVVQNKQQILQVIKYTAISLGIIVGLGYVQFIASFFADQYFFWQYWATMVSRLYYGLGLANVLVYSNSWFSYTDGMQTLRMFSIMPDSHSFAMIAALLIAYVLPFTYVYSSTQSHSGSWIYRINKTRYGLWSVVRFSGLAVILSGTRGMWVGLLVPLVIACAAFLKGLAKPLMKKIIISLAMVILFFALSPLINQGLNLLRVSQFQENFLERAASIYDLGESSNLGRLAIWQQSLWYGLTHPVGVGAGNFIVSLVPHIPVGAALADVSQQKNYVYNLPQKFVSAHSLYLHILVELGIAGLVSFLFLCWKYLSTAAAFLYSHRYDLNPYTMFVASSALTFIWFLAYGIFDVTLFNDKILIYSLISLAVSGLIMRYYEA
jgi:O-antigen ligase